uniref:Uncharacterized protein n=1 Tax=Arundo donax TaxID=35708 RepID=A0A0A9LFW1_ARUDO
MPNARSAPDAKLLSFETSINEAEVFLRLSIK